MLPFLKKKQDTSTDAQTPHPQLAMLISAGKVKCAIYEIDDHTVKILGMGEKIFSPEGKEEHLEYKVLETAAADAIDAAVQVAEVDVHECIFAIPPSWMTGLQLKEEYNEIIEKLTRSLDVEGIAFVSIPHAIAYFLQYEHKMQPTTYLAGCTREGATLSYVEKGKVMQAHKIAWRSAKLGQQIAQGLSLFKLTGERPNTMYLYGIGDLTSAKRELDQHTWASDSDTPSFVAKPDIILLQGPIDIYALALVGAKDYAKQHGITGKLTLDKQIILEDPQTAVATKPHEAPHAAGSTESPDEESSKIDNALAELTSAAGIASAATPKAAVLPHHTAVGTPKSAPLGFIVNGDIRHVDNLKPVAEDEFLDPDDAEDEELLNEKDNEEEIKPVTKRNQPTIDEESLEDAEEIESEEEESEESPRERKRFNKKPFIIALIVLLLLISIGSASAFYAYYNVPKVEVSVFVKPKSIDKNIEIFATTDAQVSSSSNTVPLQKIDVEIKETATAAATGTKKTGENAKGTVILYNKTTNERQIKKGTSLKVNNVEFLTDADVTIASASASIQGQTNGKGEVSATAKDFGTAGNIKKGVTLAVGSFARTEVEAEVKDDFTGGSETDIKVIAAKDISSLTTLLRDKAKAREPEAFAGKLATGEIRFAEAVTRGKENLTMSKKSGDEASEVTGEITYTISSYAVRESDIQQLLNAVAEQSVPEGFEKIDAESPAKLNTSFVAFGNSRLTFRASSSVSIIPILNTQAIATELVGKKESAAREAILKNGDVFDVSFSYNVSLPDPIATLPHKAENITVKRELRETNI